VLTSSHTRLNMQTDQTSSSSL